jgi:hypothetical protein
LGDLQSFASSALCEAPCTDKSNPHSVAFAADERTAQRVAGVAFGSHRAFNA